MRLVLEDAALELVGEDRCTGREDRSRRNDLQNFPARRKKEEEEEGKPTVPTPPDPGVIVMTSRTLAEVTGEQAGVPSRV